MGEFRQVSLINKLIGHPNIKSAPENDFLRILWHNGMLGLAFFLLLIFQINYFIVYRYFKNKDPIFLTGLLVEVIYLTLGFGFCVMFNPAFQWLLWGIVGFLLGGGSRRISPLEMGSVNNVV